MNAHKRKANEELFVGAKNKPPNQLDNNSPFPPQPLWTNIGILKILDKLVEKDPTDPWRWQQLNNSRDNHVTPEKLLMLALLEDGIRCAINGANSREAGESQKRRDRLWILGFTVVDYFEANWIFSFENVCDILDIDAEWLREGVRKLWQEADASTTRPTNHHTGKLWLRSIAKKSDDTVKRLERLYRQDQQEIHLSSESQKEITDTDKSR